MAKRKARKQRDDVPGPGKRAAAESRPRVTDDARYRRLFETTRDGVLLVDADSGQITNVNPYWLELTGLAADAVLGRKLWEVGAFTDGELVRSIVRELHDRDSTRYDDLSLIGPDGARRHVELACNVYRLGGRRVIQCIARDITERVDLLQRERAARAEAEAANRAKDDFLSVLSHELRTPLTAMLGWARVLRRGSLEPSRVDGALETIERNTRLLAQLIEDLLDVSRIAAGKLALEVRSVDLGVAVRVAVETVSEAATAKGVELDVAVPERGHNVSGDRRRLQQVVWNLVSNAVKFTPRGGRVSVRLEAVPEGSRITVSDTGRGIVPEILPEIFDRFRQAEAVATRTQGGLGLGLAIVRHLVALHGGRVNASSAGEGRGATFTVDLPHGALAGSPDDADDIAGPPGEATPAEARLDGLRVLVIEDEEDTRVMLTQIISQRGADVVNAASVSAGLAAFEQSVPDVIVSDIGLPGTDGYELVRRLRELPPGAGRRVPAIALTAFARTEDARRALDAGFDLHVPKPIDPAELVRLVAQVARRRR